jgi:hypothetical protein
MLIASVQLCDDEIETLSEMQWLAADLRQSITKPIQPVKRRQPWLSGRHFRLIGRYLVA